MTTTKGITKVDVVVYVVAGLGGAEKSVYSEDVAAKCYELAPNQFSWKLPQYQRKGWPDKYIVKTALEDAKKSEYGALVEGNYALEIAKDGWRLTPAGARWFNESRGRIEKELGAEQPSLPNRDAKKFLNSIAREPLLKKFLSSGSIRGSSFYELTDMLSCSPDAPVDVIRKKFRRLKSIAELANGKEVIAFLDACEAAFPQLAGSE